VQRARVDDEFRQALEGWWEQSAPIRTGAGNVTNMISGGTQQGPVGLVEAWGVVPAPWPITWSTKGHHGHSRTAPQASRPGLTHVSQVAEET
jgi:hypothetical protein